MIMEAWEQRGSLENLQPQGSRKLIENEVNWKRGIKHEYDKSVVKLQSVYGGCLGVQGR